MLEHLPVIQDLKRAPAIEIAIVTLKYPLTPHITDIQVGFVFGISADKTLLYFSRYGQKEDCWVVPTTTQIPINLDVAHIVDYKPILLVD